MTLPGRNFRANIGERVETTMSTAAAGMIDSPACIGESPWTCCRYWVQNEYTPPRAAADRRKTVRAPLTVRLAHSRTSYTGLTERSCRIRNHRPTSIQAMRSPDVGPTGYWVPKR